MVSHPRLDRVATRRWDGWDQIRRLQQSRERQRSRLAGLRRAFSCLLRVALDDRIQDLVDLRQEVRVELDLAAVTLSTTCSGLDAPMIAVATLSFCRVQATASGAMDSPASSASGLSCCTRASTSSLIHRLIMSAPPFSSVARDPSGGCSPGRYLPVSTPWAIGDQTTCEMPSSLREWHDLGLNHPPQHGVLRLVGDQLETEFGRELMPVAQLVRGPLADPDVEHLALPDEVGECLHRLFQRCLYVVAVCLVEVDVSVCSRVSEPSAASMMCLRDSPTSLCPWSDRPEDLGEDLQRLPPLALERLAQHRLGLGVGVNVGGVEGGDTGTREPPARMRLPASFSTCEPCVSQLP